MASRRRPSRQLALPVKVEETVPLEVYESLVHQFEESISDLERALHEPGWIKFTAQADMEFTRAGLLQIAAVCRLMAIKNPLIKRGLSLRTSYVWGQGVDIASPSDGKAEDGTETQDVNGVVQGFLDDPSNLRSFSSAQARESMEREVYTSGNLFPALFTNPKTGRVQVRILPTDEIQDVVCNPDDASEPWFYQRNWTRRDLDGNTKTITEFYPDLAYLPAAQRRQMVKNPNTGESGRVHWDAPVVHVAPNKPLGWKFGIPDCYAAVDWARAVKEFLEDWARYMKALTLFVWKITNPGNKKSAVRSRAADSLKTDPTTGEPLRAGATALTTPNASLEAVSKSGATIDADSVRPLAYMVAAALDVPVTMLLSDPGLTGARAVAESLDAPTELMAQQRRGLWTSLLDTVLGYVIDRAIEAPRGPLKGVKDTGPYGQDMWILSDDSDRSVQISWPDLDDVPAETIIKGLVDADSTQKIPAPIMMRALLRAIGEKNVDEIVEKYGDRLDDFQPGLGQKVVDAFKRGQDPAAPLTDDDSDDEDAGNTGDPGPSN